MIYRLILNAILIVSFANAPLSAATIGKEAQKFHRMVHKCHDQKRQMCVVMASTSILTSIDIMDYMFKNDQEGLTHIAELFVIYSFKISIKGRPAFRKFLTENALWTLDYYNENYRSHFDKNYLYDDVRHIYSGFQILRAQACHELQNTPCAVAALWNVNNTLKAGRWQEVVTSFNMDDDLAVDLLNKLNKIYQGQF